jgi:hypothetical protein
MYCSHHTNRELGLVVSHLDDCLVDVRYRHLHKTWSVGAQEGSKLCLLPAVSFPIAATICNLLPNDPARAASLRDPSPRSPKNNPQTRKSLVKVSPQRYLLSDFSLHPSPPPPPSLPYHFAQLMISNQKDGTVSMTPSPSFLFNYFPHPLDYAKSCCCPPSPPRPPSFSSSLRWIIHG